MLVVNYNGNKPIANYYKYGVEGNNDADIVRFVVLKKQGGLDLTDNFLVYVKCDNESGFVDKVEIESADISVKSNNIFVDWHLLKKHTEQESLRVSLCFENENEIVWQTQVFQLKLLSGVNADTEIENTYPSVLQDLQNQINSLGDIVGKITVEYDNNSHYTEITFPREVIPLAIYQQRTHSTKRYYFNYEDLVIVDDNNVEAGDIDANIIRIYGDKVSQWKNKIVDIEYILRSGKDSGIVGRDFNAYYFYHPIKTTGTKLYAHIVSFEHNGWSYTLKIIGNFNENLANKDFDYLNNNFIETNKVVATQFLSDNWVSCSLAVVSSEASICMLSPFVAGYIDCFAVSSDKTFDSDTVVEL